MRSPFKPKDLLSPVGWESFLDHTWEKEHLYVSARGAGYYDKLFRMEDVDALVPLAVGERGVRLAKDGDKSVVPNDAPSLYRAYQEGSTIVINRVHRMWRSVNLLCLALEQRLHHPTGVNLYLTPPRAQGFAAHYDTHDVFILQIAGRKIWDLHGIGCELPLEGEKAPLSAADIGPAEHTLVMEPGALLYMPRGMVHSARTSDDSSSLHLTLGVHVLRWGDLMAQALQLARLEDADFRRALPVGFLNQPPGELTSHLRKLLGRLAQREYPAAVSGVAERMFARTPAPIDHHFSVLDALPSLADDTLLRKRTGTVYYVYEEGEQLVVRYSGGTVAVPRRIKRALDFILTSDWFSVASIPQLDAEGRLVLARRLVREGLLTTA